MSRLNNSTYLTLGVVSITNIAILLIRNAIVKDSAYNFLLFNLFLGVIPLLTSLIALYYNKTIRLIPLCILSGLWLLFYPNAPYMITDLIHVQAGSQTVVYDTLIIFSISILSLFYGFFSLKIIHDIWIQHFSKKLAYIFVSISILLASFGIYLGRILRLNSWDLFTEPWKVISDIAAHLWPPNENPSTYYIIILFTIIQGFILYLTRDLDFDKV